jgi:hypothetical protein
MLLHTKFGYYYRTKSAVIKNQDSAVVILKNEILFYLTNYILI